MAEFVQQRKEAFVPILEHILSQGLLSRSEQMLFSQRVDEFEHKIQRQTRTAGDVTNYAHYLADLILELENRRTAAGNFNMLKEIEGQLKNKIYSLFGTYNRNFRTDSKYWDEALNVIVKLKSLTYVSKMIEEYVKHAGQISKRPWKLAIVHFYKHTAGGPIEGIKIARTYVQRCIRAFQRDLEVYLWAVDLELKHDDFLYKSEFSGTKANTHQDFDFKKERRNSLHLAKTFYTSAKESCWAKGVTVSLYEQLFKVLDKYERCEDFRNILMRDLESNCSSEEEAYKVLAKLEIDRSNIGGGIDYLEKGLQTTPTMKMYDICVETLISLLKDTSLGRNHLNIDGIYDKMLGVLQQGHNNDKLSADNYGHWIDAKILWHPPPSKKPVLANEAVENKRNESKLSKESINELQSIVKMALQKYPDNDKILSLNIQIALMSSSNSDMLELLRFACEKAGFKEADKVFYDYVLMNEALLDRIPAVDSHKKPLKTLLQMRGCPYQEGVLKRYLTSCYLKGYGEFMNKEGRPNRGLEHARKAFEAIKGHNNHYCLFKVMANIEMCVIDSKDLCPLKRVRTIMETAVLHHGTSNIEVWNDYITFERRQNNVKEVTDLQARAKRTLRSDLAQIFTLGM